MLLLPGDLLTINLGKQQFKSDGCSPTPNYLMVWAKNSLNTPKSTIFFQNMYYYELETNWKHQTNQETIKLQYKFAKLYHPKHSIKITETFKCFEKTIYETIVSRQHIISPT